MVPDLSMHRIMHMDPVSFWTITSALGYSQLLFSYLGIFSAFNTLNVASSIIVVSQTWAICESEPLGLSGDHAFSQLLYNYTYHKDISHPGG